jgi:hypothetical protein
VPGMGTSTTAATTRRWPRAGHGQKKLLGATVMVLAGAFMPWVDTAVGSVTGMQGAGLWTFYAATLGLAGALVPNRRLATIQAAILAIAAVGLPLWQVVHLFSLVGMQGWIPGAGLVLTFGGGVLAGVAARSLHRGEGTPPSS